MAKSSFSWDEWNRTKATRYPQNHVVQYCFRQFPDSRKGLRALDLGCGSGVHTVFLAIQGFDVSATDKSPVGIANTSENLLICGLNADLRAEGAEVVSFPASFFDLVICIGIFDTVGPEIALASVERLLDVMKPGARGMFLFSSDVDDSVRRDNTCGFHGYNRGEVESLFFRGFTEVCIDRCNLTYFNGSVVQDEWIVSVKR